MDYLDKGRQILFSSFSSQPPVQYHGLLNQGATCYLNSVLQVLFMTGDFREAVERHCCENPATECIDRHLKALFDDLKGQTAYTYNITRKLGIDRVYEQQDAAEYYEKILSLTSPDASQIFHGWLTDRTTCSSCGTETDTDGAFWHLPLALVDSYSEHYSVVDGIKEHFRASDFSGENQMYCEQCDAKSDATIQCVVKHHPEVLMLLLKRFDFDYRYMTYVKINQTVDVPRTLQIPENQTYELYAVVDHSGDLRSGHYSATIWDDENWFIFDDKWVKLADYQPFQVDNFERSRSAYLLFYRKKNATQTPRPVSAPGGHLPATGDVYDQCQDLGKKRGREEGEDITRYEETERVRSRGVELQPDPRNYVNYQDTIPHIHQVCNEERNEKNHLQDTQAEEHRDEVEILTGDKNGIGGNAEAENKAEDMDPLCRVTQREESVDDQDSGKDSAPDVSDDSKEVEMGGEERGVMDVKTGEDKQSEKEEKSLMKYPEDNAGENIGENLRGTQEVGQDYDLKPVSEDEQRDERGMGVDDKEGKTEADEKGIASEVGRLSHDLCSREIQDYGRDGSSKRSMPKDEHQQRGERMDVQEVEQQKRGDDNHAQRTDTSVTERYPSEGVQAQDSDSVRRSDASVHPEQKISITPTIQKDVELDEKGKTGVNEREMGSGPRKPLKISNLCPSNENQDYRRDDNNKQKMPKGDQRCEEGGSNRHKEQRDVKGVMEKKRGDSERRHFGQDVEDQSTVGLHDSKMMSEQKISGTYTSCKDVSAETESKHIQNKSDPSLRRAGSSGSRKPTEYQGADRGEQMRRSNSQPKPTLEYPESIRKERPSSKNIKRKIPDIESHSEKVAGTSAEDNLPKKFDKLNLNEPSPTKPEKRASESAIKNAPEEESKAPKKRRLSDTKDQAEKKRGKSPFSCLPFPRKKQKEKGEKKKRNTGCFPFIRQENVDSD